MADSDRYKQLAAAYLAAAAEKKKDGEAEVGARRVADARRSGPDHAGDSRRAEGARQARRGTHRQRHGFRLT